MANNPAPGKGAYEAQGRESNGQYATNGSMCVCGHAAGIHAGEKPHPCFNEDTGIEGATGEACHCQKFKAAKPHPSQADGGAEEAAREVVKEDYPEGTPPSPDHLRRVTAIIQKAIDAALKSAVSYEDQYLRIVQAFDKSSTANEFLSEDGEGGFSAGVFRMAREIDRLRALQAKPESGAKADGVDELAKLVRIFHRNITKSIDMRSDGTPLQEQLLFVREFTRPSEIALVTFLEGLPAAPAHKEGK